MRWADRVREPGAFHCLKSGVITMDFLEKVTVGQRLKEMNRRASCVVLGVCSTPRGVARPTLR